MALLKTKTLESGIDVSYFKVIKIDVSCCDWGGSFYVSAYKDQQARLDGKPFIQTEAFHFDSGVFNPANMTEDNIVSECYKLLKEQDSFYSDATEV